MLYLAFLGWLDAHSGAVTAIATVVLVGVTIVYVVITYLLVREQRLQKQVPKVEYEFVPGLHQQTEKPPKADLKLQNVGTGTATELAILRGPKEGIDADLPELGQRMTLLPGEVHEWRIRTPGDGTDFLRGELPLTMTYFGNDKTRVIFEIMILRFEERSNGWRGDNLGSITASFDRRELRRLARRDERLWRRPWFQWKMRRFDLPRLLLREDVRESLRRHLGTGYDELILASAQMRNLRHRI